MAWACNRHNSQYYCDECSPPSERERDEASNRTWFDINNPPQRQYLTEGGPVDVPKQSNFVNIVETDDYLLVCRNTAPNHIRKCTLPTGHVGYHEHLPGVGVIHRWEDGADKMMGPFIDGVEVVPGETVCLGCMQKVDKCLGTAETCVSRPQSGENGIYEVSSGMYGDPEEFTGPRTWIEPVTTKALLPTPPEHEDASCFVEDDPNTFYDWTGTEWYRRPDQFKTVLEEPGPIPMLLNCPECQFSHIDKPEPDTGWENPPHRTHLCSNCGHKWRPSLVHTTGVAELPKATTIKLTPISLGPAYPKEGDLWYDEPQDQHKLVRNGEIVKISKEEAEELFANRFNR